MFFKKQNIWNVKEGEDEEKMEMASKWRIYLPVLHQSHSSYGGTFDILFLPKYQKGENVGAEMKGGEENELQVSGSLSSLT